jgi:competence protein ComEC
MKYLKKYFNYILVSILVFSLIFIIYFIFNQNKDSKYLKVVFLDIGQGDAIYIQAPNGKQVLIDGGSGKQILPKLIRVMPIFDKSIDMVIATNPDLDHIGGLVEVLKNYKVGTILESGIKPDTLIYKNLEEEILKNKVIKKNAQLGMHILLDEKENIYFDVLFPDRDVSDWERNDGSIVGQLVYKNKSFMFMGDATKYTENLMEWNKDLKNLKSNVLKLGHHGSRTSTGVLWLERVDPDVAIISAGKNNTYGHPHKETINNLNSLGIKFLETYKYGNLIFRTDGENLIFH